MTDIWQKRRDGWSPQMGDARNGYDVDYSRVVHSYSFRRLQGKTQILNLGDSDFYRTRLTHSLEVAQIASGIRRQLEKDSFEDAFVPFLPDFTLIQAIGLTHDLGHPPFGHGGEVALNYCMKEDGGFEGNGQTLRILSRLEHFSKDCGSNFTRRSLLGVLKYPVQYSTARNKNLSPTLYEDLTTVPIIDRKASKPPKCYLDTEKDVVDWILSELSPNDADEFVRFQEVKGKHNKCPSEDFMNRRNRLADFGLRGLNRL